MRPNLGQFEFAGSKKNNIITWDGYGQYDNGSEPHLDPFKDSNPNCKPDECYKGFVYAVVGSRPGLRALKSSDGIHWSPLSDQPVFTKDACDSLNFDSQNLAFWDMVRGEYRAFIRSFSNGLRGVFTATSQDFVNWSEPVRLEYPGSPVEQLYTSQVAPYYRAPHIFLGFPSRYIIRAGKVVTDGLFMSSRDGCLESWPPCFGMPTARCVLQGYKDTRRSSPI